MNEPATQPSERLMSLDAYRGFIMLVMASGGFGFAKVAETIDEGSRWTGLWNVLGYQFSHVAWTGCSFWDLIQPSFMFMVGVALPYSYASRLAKGQPRGRIVAHAAVRAAVLVALGVFLASGGAARTNFVFTNVLAQIGLGYCFLYVVLGRGLAVQAVAAAAILVGYWLLFYLYPVPPDDFDWKSVGVPDDWELFLGTAAHWNKNANAAAAVDQWFLNLFPRGEPFHFNDGGYQTLNFVPSLATMIFGVMAGELLRGDRESRAKRNRLFLGGAACLLAGLAVDHTIWPERLMSVVDWVVWKVSGPTSFVMDPAWTLCPIVKRIWTPSFAVFSTGWTLWMLAVFYWIIDMEGLRRWSFPLVVVGLNSIAMYCMSQLLKPWVRGVFKTHIGPNIFAGTFGPVIESTSVLAMFWLACWWMYRKKVFVRI
jgi:predicted acyltransferase